jgi:hypothetical protein
MSAPREPFANGLIARLPEWARPRESERRGMGSLRLAETTILILVGVFCAIATVNDVVSQTHVNRRLNADLRTWRTVTGHDYHSVGVEQDVIKYTTKDTVCGNTSPGAPGERTQLCLTLVGPTIHGMRVISGGYYLPPYVPNDPLERYACFGTSAETGLCGKNKRPAGSPPTPAVRTGLP